MPAPTSATTSPTTTRASMYSALTLPPEVTTMTKTLDDLKSKMGSMGALLDAVGKGTIEMASKGTEPQTEKHIKSIRKELTEKVKKEDEQIKDIQALLQKALEQDVMEHLRTLVEAGILDQIDQIVTEQVKAQLPSYFPEELQIELDRHMMELDEVQRALHNSESRRANSQLRSSNLKEPLHTIYKSDGTISAHFPKDVSGLFNMDAEIAVELCEEYGLSDISEIRERNINYFMRFCGITYQLVSTKGGTPVVLKRMQQPAYE